MQTARRLEHDAGVAPVDGPYSGKLIGLAVVALCPAFFWTALLAVVGPFFGLSLTFETLSVVAISIAVFLSIVFSSLTLGVGDTDEG